MEENCYYNKLKNILPIVLKVANKLGKRPTEKDMNYISDKMGLVSIFGA